MKPHSRLTAQDLSDRTPVLAHDVLVDAWPDREIAEVFALAMGALIKARGLADRYGVYIARTADGAHGIYVGPHSKPKGVTPRRNRHGRHRVTSRQLTGEA